MDTQNLKYHQTDIRAYIASYSTISLYLLFGLESVSTVMGQKGQKGQQVAMGQYWANP